MWDDVSANKSLIGNERETPSTRSPLMVHTWLLNVAIWVVRSEGKRIPCIPGGFCLHGAGLAEGVASRRRLSVEERHGESRWRGLPVRARAGFCPVRIPSRARGGAPGALGTSARRRSAARRASGNPRGHRGCDASLPYATRCTRDPPDGSAGWGGGRRRGVIEAKWGETENTERMLMLEKGEVRGRT